MELGKGRKETHTTPGVQRGLGNFPFTELYCILKVLNVDGESAAWNMECRAIAEEF
jgi:hypothetical protein